MGVDQTGTAGGALISVSGFSVFGGVVGCEVSGAGLEAEDPPLTAHNPSTLSVASTQEESGLGRVNHAFITISSPFVGPLVTLALPSVLSPRRDMSMV